MLSLVSITYCEYIVSSCCEVKSNFSQIGMKDKTNSTSSENAYMIVLNITEFTEIQNLVFYHLVFYSGNFYLIAPFPDNSLLLPSYTSGHFI